MLSKENRLSRSRDFKEIFHSGVYTKGKFISIKVKKRKASSVIKTTRIGFVIGQKITKKAILRNKLKRYLRSAVRECMKEIKPGADVVVMPTPDILDKSLKEITVEIRDVFKKARLL